MNLFGWVGCEPRNSRLDFVVIWIMIQIQEPDLWIILKDSLFTIVIPIDSLE